MTIFTSKLWAYDCASGNQTYACYELLIRFSPSLSSSDIQDLLEEHSLYEIKSFQDGKIRHVEDYSGRTVPDSLALLKKTPGVFFVEPNLKIQVASTPNDPYFDSLWGMKSQSQAGINIDVLDVWDEITDASSVIVAIIDTGIDYNHEDLAENMWTNPGEIPGNGLDDDANGYIDDVHGYDFVNGDGDPIDDHYHGTHCAGTVGAIGNNGIGVVGVAWNVQIMAVKFLSSSGSGYLSDAIDSIEYAVDNGAKILSNSWGGGGFYTALSNMITYADNHGAIFVVAAGNSGMDIDSYPQYPASYAQANIISVASTTSSQNRSYFSNFGANSVDIGAPGSSILSTYPGDSYTYLSGTSMATPHVSGAAALLWAQYPNLTHRQVINHLLAGAEPTSAMNGITTTGGVLNLRGAFLSADPSFNNTPSANAGSSQKVARGSTVLLSGSGLDEDSSDVLTYSWTLSDPNSASSVLSSNSSSRLASFSAQILGKYYASLRVSDDYSTSAPSQIVIEVVEPGSTLPPKVEFKAKKNSDDQELTENENGNSEAPVGERIVLDASSSLSLSGANNLDYEWVLLTKPSGSSASIDQSEEAIAYLNTDLEGIYTVKLMITDDISTSEAELNFQAVSLELGDDGSHSGAAGSAGGCSIHARPSSQERGLILFVIMLFPIFTLQLFRVHTRVIRS